MMRLLSVDYTCGPTPSAWVHRAWWLKSVPRLMLLCRLLGHRPVVDGTGGFPGRGLGDRWVVCDRCGVRPEPQGSLDPAVWHIGDRYTGSWDEAPSTGTGLPERWPARPTGTLGAQVVLGVREPQLGFTVKVGNCGSEQTLAVDVHLPWIGSLFLHTEQFGQWVVRRFNRTGYHSRVTGFDVSGGYLRWSVWARRDRCSSSDPWWMRGSVQVDLRTVLLGPKRYTSDDVGEPVTVPVRLPHGDQYEVRLQLRRRVGGRRRGRKRVSWWVAWAADGGIPTKPGDAGRIYDSATAVTDASVAAGTWQAEAASLITAQIVDWRKGYGWEPAESAFAS